ASALWGCGARAGPAGPAHRWSADGGDFRFRVQAEEPGGRSGEGRQGPGRERETGLFLGPFRVYRTGDGVRLERGRLEGGPAMVRKIVRRLLGAVLLVLVLVLASGCTHSGALPFATEAAAGLGGPPPAGAASHDR